MKPTNDPYMLPVKPEPGVLYGEIHDASKCCIEGWGCWVASVCRGGSKGTAYKYEPGMQNVFEVGFRQGDTTRRTEAHAEALAWLKSVALSRGMKLKLYVYPPDGHAGKVKLVDA